MKRLISIIIAIAMLIGIAPLAVFAGGGNDFPPVPCINEGDPIRAEGEYEFDFTGEGVYIDLYTGAAGMYTIESESDLDLYCYVYDGEGQQLGYDDDSGEYTNFKCYCDLEYRTDVYIYVGMWGSSSGHVKVTVSRSDVQSVDVISWPTKTTYLPNDRNPDLAGLTFRINYANGDKATWMPASGEYSDVESPDGVICKADFEDEPTPGYANRVIIECYGFRFVYDVSFLSYNFDEARVTRMPYRTEYIVGLDNHSFYPDGMLIQLCKNGSPVETVNFRNDSPAHPFFQDYVFPDEYSLGDNTVTVRFTNGVTAELTVTGIENPYKSIEFVKLPDKTVYDTTPNGFFPAPDLTGAVLRIHYKNDDYYDYTFENNYDWQILGHYYMCDFESGLSVGTNTVMFEYCGMTCSFNVTGVESKLKSIELTKLPDRTVYYIGEQHPSIKGAVLKVNYTDNTYKTIVFKDDTRYVDGFYIDFWFDGDITVAGANTATLWYGGESVTIDVTFVESGIKRITVAQEPYNNEFALSSVVRPEDLDGLVLNVTYKDGTTESWDFAANGGIFKGSQTFSAAYIQHDGYNAVTLDMAGNPATIYLLAKDFYVMQREIINNADAFGNNATIKFTLEDGKTFEVTFVGKYNENDYATGFFTLPGYGTFSYDLYRNVTLTGVKGVNVYVFQNNEPIFVPMEEGGVMKGDMDGDGEISVADALAALRIAAKLAPETAASVEIGDTDGDGHVTVSDALAILRVAAKLADPSSLG